MKKIILLTFAILLNACSPSNNSTELRPAAEPASPNPAAVSPAEIHYVDHDSSQFQKAIDIAVGPGLSCAILESGDGKCWGASFFGKMGWNGFHWNDFKNVSVIGGGVDAACAAVGPDRELQCTGYSVQFDLHRGPKQKVKGVTEISMDKLIGCATSSNLVTCWGHDLYGQPAPSGISVINPRQLRVYDSMSCVASDKGVVCWNYIGWGLDAPKDLQQVTDLAVSEFDACAMDDVRGLVCWRSNDDNFHKGYSEYNLLKKNVKMSNLHFVGYKEICGVQGQEIQCYSLDGTGQRSFPVPIKNASKLAIGRAHTCGLTAQGVECSGQNENGEVVTPQGLNKPFQIAAAMNFNCALEANGLRCWGDNFYDQVTPPFILKNPTQMATNGYTTCVDDEDKFRCWSRKQTGQPGGSEFSLSSELHGAKSIAMSRDFNADRVCGLKDATVICGNDTVSGMQNPRELSVSKSKGCAISDTGVRCWDFGYVGLQSKPLPIALVNPSLIAIDEDVSCAVADQNLNCWDKKFKFMAVPGLKGISELHAKNKVACAITQGTVNCWAYYSFDGSFKMGTVPENLNAPRGLTMSETTACVITNNGVRCWELYSGREMLVPNYNLVK